jgi:hypothetical protein
MTVLYLVGGFLALCAVFALIDWLHSRWAWRQSEREVRAMMGQRKPRPSPPSPVPPICADTGAPKDPRGCWNVRCQLGGTCCRTSGVRTSGADQPKGGA